MRGRVQERVRKSEGGCGVGGGDVACCCCLDYIELLSSCAQPCVVCCLWYVVLCRENLLQVLPPPPRRLSPSLLLTFKTFTHALLEGGFMDVLRVGGSCMLRWC